MRRYLAGPAVFGLLLAGCGPEGVGFDFPVSHETEQSGYPGLVPIDAFQEGMIMVPDPAPELEARVAALRSRAEAMSGPVLSKSDRDRLSGKAAP